MFNRENYKRIKQEFTAKHLAAGETQRARMREVEAGHPELAEINAALIVEGKTGDAERDALEAEYEEEFTTTYEKVSGKRLWLDFLKKN